MENSTATKTNWPKVALVIGIALLICSPLAYCTGALIYAAGSLPQ